MIILCMLIWVYQMLLVYWICYIPWYEKSYGILCTFISIKSSLCIYYRTGTQKFKKLLCLNSLFGGWLMSIDHWTFYGVMKPTFISMDNLTLTTIEFGQRKTLMVYRTNPCICKKWQFDAILQTLYHWAIFFWRDNCKWNPNLLCQRTMVP